MCHSTSFDRKVRGANKLTGGNVDEALADYDQALEFGADKTATAPLEAQLVSVLTSQFQRSVTANAYDKAAVDYGLIARLDPSASAALTGDLEKLPPAVFVKLPPIRNSIGMDLKLIPPG